MHYQLDKKKLFQKVIIRELLKEIDSTYRKNILFSKHHYSHAASAFPLFLKML